MIRTIFGLLGLVFAAQAAAAEPILVPDFTPGTPDEFAVTAMIQTQVTERLVQDGHIVLAHDVVAPVVGPEAITRCDALPTCPGAVLPKLPTRLALVVRVNRLGGTLVGHFELFEQSNPSPVVVRDVPIAPGNEHLFAHEISSAASALVAQIGPSPDAVLMAAARLIAGQDPSAAPPQSAAPPPHTAAPPPPVDPVAPVAPAAPEPITAIRTAPPGPAAPRPPAAPGPHAPDAPIGALLDGTGVAPRHLLGSEAHFRASGLDPRDWIFKAMPHAGRFVFEIRAGLGMGDVDRQADMRVSLVANRQQDTWYQEGPVGGRRPRGGIFVGYAPATMLDVGLVAGLQYGKRFFTTGYARYSPANETTKVDADRGYTAVDAVQLYLQPRVRAYLVPTGPAKPFLFTGADIRIFDAYDLEQPPGFTYLNPPAGVVPGWIGGGGMMIDPSPIVGFFFEGNYTHHFGLRAATMTSGLWEHETPAAPTGTFYTIGLTGGVQFRI